MSAVRELAKCGHLSCPTYRCFYDGLCEWSWGNEDECRLSCDPDADLRNYCTFHAQVVMAQYVREYREEDQRLQNAMFSKQEEGR